MSVDKSADTSHPHLGEVVIWGFAAPCLASAAMATIAFIAASVMVPETRTPEVHRRERLWGQRAAELASAPQESFRASLPEPLDLFLILLLIDFVGVFAFGFVEPQMVFYFYEQLDWTTVQFGTVVGAYGLAMVLGQTVLGQLSDGFGRKPVIVVGVFLTMTFYVGLALVSQFALTLLVAIVAGAGAGLTASAMSAFYLDITPAQHRSRVMGIKGSTTALGVVVGPLLVAVVSAMTTPQGIFTISAVLLASTLLLALVVLREPQHAAEEKGDVVLESSRRRALCAQASLRGVVLQARAARKAHLSA
jgi:MFS family permease